jgi:hypothetical protein
MIAWIHRVLRRETMDGGGVCPTYLTRWTLFRLPFVAVYLHCFSGSDWAIDLHDHPKRFISIGLRGRYVEHTPTGTREWRAPWVRSFPAEHRHRLELRSGEFAWTLVIVGRATRPWGFWLDGRWLPWRRYVREHGRARRNC